MRRTGRRAVGRVADAGAPRAAPHTPGQTTRPDHGAAAVEFALISVLLLTLLFGIVQYGLYFFQATAVASFTNQVGRLSALRGDCGQWQGDVGEVVDRAGLRGRISEVRTDGAVQRGDLMIVEVSWQPARTGLVPLPTVNEQRTAVRGERLGGTADPECTWTPTTTVPP